MSKKSVAIHPSPATIPQNDLKGALVSLIEDWSNFIVTKFDQNSENRNSRVVESGEDEISLLDTRDEIRYLLDQISTLQAVINGNESRAARLVAPIYVKDQPVFPQKRNSLLLGLLLGGFLGLLLAVARKWYRSNFALKR